jgi:hypothetical protein
MSDVQQENARPTAITVICILGFIGAGLGLLGSLALLALAPVIGIISIAVVAIGLLAMILIWQMKKMGVYLYAGMTALNIRLHDYARRLQHPKRCDPGDRTRPLLH